MALLGMKLSARDVSATYDGSKFESMECSGQNILGVGAYNVIGVDKVESGRISESMDQIAVVFDVERIPSHMRNFEGTQGWGELESLSVGFDPSQTRHVPLFAGSGKQLHAETNTEYRNGSMQNPFVEKWDEAAAREIRHSLVKRAYTGENQFLSGGDGLMIGRDFGIGTASPQHVEDGSQVSHPVVDDHDHLLSLNILARQSGACAGQTL